MGVPYGLVVRILAFHAGGPGSIPGVGRIFCILISYFFALNLDKLVYDKFFLSRAERLAVN
jgi:hypothetical protein